MLNPYEITKFMIQGEGFCEDITFEKLPNDLEDEVNLGDCIINMQKVLNFFISNNSKENVKFAWNN